LVTSVTAGPSISTTTAGAGVAAMATVALQSSSSTPAIERIHLRVPATPIAADGAAVLKRHILKRDRPGIHENAAAHPGSAAAAFAAITAFRATVGDR
jgi:hypothetical protein